MSINRLPSGLLCAKGSHGGAGSGGGGLLSNSDVATYTFHELHGCDTSPNNESGFSSSEFINFLKADTESEIERLGGKVVESENLDDLSFLIKYLDEKIEGQIEIKGSLSGDKYFRLEATLKETSSSTNKPIIEERNRGYQPVGNYHVVVFARDAAAEGEAFLKIGMDESKRQSEKLRKRHLQGRSESDLETAVVYIWKPLNPTLPAHIWQSRKELYYDNFQVPEEYNEYSFVYFLNDIAIKMYRDLAGKFDIFKTVPAEEVAKIGITPCLSLYYFPED